MRAFRSGPKARFEVHVTGDARQTFVTEIPQGQLKHSLMDHILIPFIEQVNHSKTTQIACSYIEVNGVELKTEREVNRPLSEFWSGEAVSISLTLELVDELKKRKATTGSFSPMMRGKQPTAKMNVYSVEKVEFDAPHEPEPQLGTVHATSRSPTSLESAMGKVDLSPGSRRGNHFMFDGS